MKEKMEEKKTVLILEDEERILRFMRLSLRNAGYEVLTAMRGNEALELMRSASPNILLLDVFMPGMNGFQVLQQVRTFSQLPVLVISARTSCREEALNLGANDFLAKPFRPEVLLERIRALLK